jgi:hypothetical protein
MEGEPLVPDDVRVIGRGDDVFQVQMKRLSSRWRRQIPEMGVALRLYVYGVFV